MDDVLDDLKIGRYKRVMVTADEGGEGTKEKKKEEIIGF
jgi:hypothetical protein